MKTGKGQNKKEENNRNKKIGISNWNSENWKTGCERPKWKGEARGAKKEE